MRELEVAIPTHSEQRTVREFVDEQGTPWRVSEVDGAHVPGGHGAQCLIFASAATIRRVWEYPADWYGHSVRDLSALSWRR